MKSEEELREECDFVLDELKCARVTVLANGGLELEGQRTVAAPENRPATEFHDGVYNETQKFVRIGLAADEFSALIIDEYVCIEGYGYSALENGGLLIVGCERDDWGYHSSVAAFSLADLRNGLELGDLTDDYRAYAAALLGAGVMDTRVWRRMFAFGIPAEYAATLYAQAAA